MCTIRLRQANVANIQTKKSVFQPTLPRRPYRISDGYIRPIQGETSESYRPLDWEGGSASYRPPQRGPWIQRRRCASFARDSDCWGCFSTIYYKRDTFQNEDGDVQTIHTPAFPAPEYGRLPGFRFVLESLRCFLCSRWKFLPTPLHCGKLNLLSTRPNCANLPGTRRARNSGQTQSRVTILRRRSHG